MLLLFCVVTFVRGDDVVVTSPCTASKNNFASLAVVRGTSTIYAAGACDASTTSNWWSFAVSIDDGRSFVAKTFPSVLTSVQLAPVIGASSSAVVLAGSANVAFGDRNFVVTEANQGVVSGSPRFDDYAVSANWQTDRGLQPTAVSVSTNANGSIVFIAAVPGYVLRCDVKTLVYGGQWTAELYNYGRFGENAIFDVGEFRGQIVGVGQYGGDGPVWWRETQGNRTVWQSLPSKTWKLASLLNALANNDTTMLAVGRERSASGAGMILATNDAANWFPVHQRANSEYVDIAFGGGVWCAVAQDELLLSRDALNWQAVPSSALPPSIAGAPFAAVVASANALVVSGAGFVVSSRDAGSSWQLAKQT